MTRFSIYLFIICAVTALVTYAFGYLTWIILPTKFVWITLFIAALSFLIHRFITEKFSKNRETFSMAYLGSIAAKLLFYTCFLGIILYFDLPNAMGNAVYFLVLYSATTLNDMLFLIKKGKQFQD